jgi:phosphoenolpyruvate carboxykinase (ATP)
MGCARRPGARRVRRRHFAGHQDRGFAVPTSLPGVEPDLLYPFKTWRDKTDFDQTARKLVRMFRDNFVRFESHVDDEVRAAAPKTRVAA